MSLGKFFGYGELIVPNGTALSAVLPKFARHWNTPWPQGGRHRQNT